MRVRVSHRDGQLGGDGAGASPGQTLGTRIFLSQAQVQKFKPATLQKAKWRPQDSKATHNHCLPVFTTANAKFFQRGLEQGWPGQE